MHELFSSASCLELRSYVRAFAQRRTGHAGNDLIEPMPACLEQTLDFEFGERPVVAFGDGRRFPVYPISLVGPSAYCPVNLHLCGGVESFAVFFQPLGFLRLFGVPMNHLVNKQYDARDVLGGEIERLWCKLAGAVSFASRVALVESYLLEKAGNSRTETLITNVALYMFKCGGAKRISDVADHTSLGLRQFERRFKSHIGMSPKLYSRVARFQAVLDAKIHRDTTSWLDLIYRFGYHDQMHLIKDFRGLSGLPPECLLQRIGDIRPFALTSAGMDDTFPPGNVPHRCLRPSAKERTA